MKILEIIKEYKEMRNQVKGMQKYFSKAEIVEMMKYCNSCGGADECQN